MARIKWNIETVKIKLNEVNPNVELLETEYVNNATKMKCLCKIHNYEFSTAWAQLQTGHGCPMCGGSMPLTMNIVKERLSKINDNIEILDDEYVNLHHKMKCRCKIDGYEWFVHAGNLLHNNRGCPRCAKNERMTTEQALERLIESTIDIEFGEFEYKNQRTKIPCKCKIDGHEWNPIFNSLVRGSGCPVCVGKTVMTKRNDVASSRPELLKYFKNQYDAESYTEGSNKKVDMVCPDCGSERVFPIAQLTAQGFSCKICGDGISRNNKIMINMFQQLGIELLTEYKIKGYRYSYDGMFVANGKKYLLEMHGSQHYEYSGRGRQLEYEIENDKIKKQIATKNEYVYIDVDCNIFDYDYIVSNIKKSIGDILDLSNVNWKECFDFSYKSLVVLACEIRANSNNEKTTGEIGREIGMTKSTISGYLKLGNKLGLCKYDPKIDGHKVQLQNNKKSSQKLSKKVVQLTIDGSYIKEFDSMHMAYRETRVSPSCICNCCKGKKDSASGFKWMYLEDYKRM